MWGVAGAQSGLLGRHCGGLGEKRVKWKSRGVIATWIDVGGGVIWVKFWWDQSQIYGLGANSIAHDILFGLGWVAVEVAHNVTCEGRVML